jgi:hypothetical protein
MESRAAFEGQDINGFVASLPPELKTLFDELYLYASAEVGVDERNIGRLAYEIRERSLKREIQSLLSNDDAKNEEDLSRLNMQLKELEKKAVTV